MSTGMVWGSPAARGQGGDAVPVDSAPPLLRWTALCAGAEALGLAASAGAAKASQLLVGEPAGARTVAVALGLVVAGGLVEGVVLGLAQEAGLAGWLGSRRRRWVWTTAAVAGLGWAAASLPSLLAPAGGPEPRAGLVLAGAAGVGLVLGSVLGGVQAVVLRGRVPHPWRWVTASTLGWTVAKPVVFVGAGLPGPGWSVASVVGLGAGTGLAAGTVLGLLSGLVLPSLDGPSPSSRLVATVLTSPLHGLLDGKLVVLRLRGTLTGRTRTLPVAYAKIDDGLVLVPGHPERKRWWRNLRRPSPVTVWTHGRWRPAEAQVLLPEDPEYAAAVAACRARWPRLPVDRRPLVKVEWTGPAYAAAPG